MVRREQKCCKRLQRTGSARSVAQLFQMRCARRRITSRLQHSTPLAHAGQVGHQKGNRLHGPSINTNQLASKTTKCAESLQPKQA
mmetsp:Transcript_80041/g.147255  ORF Transcript_80041/g.147255 Transcript_80041/m.147255 type:complete len:85 (+) Transcript_80041:1581-1835(+)